MDFVKKKSNNVDDEWNKCINVSKFERLLIMFANQE